MTISKDILINTVRKNLAYNWIYLFFLGNERKVHRRGLFRSISLQKGIALKKQKEFANRAREIRIHRWFFSTVPWIIIIQFYRIDYTTFNFRTSSFRFWLEEREQCWLHEVLGEETN